MNLWRLTPRCQSGRKPNWIYHIQLTFQVVYDRAGNLGHQWLYHGGSLQYRHANLVRKTNFVVCHLLVLTTVRSIFFAAFMALIMVVPTGIILGATNVQVWFNVLGEYIAVSLSASMSFPPLLLTRSGLRDPGKTCGEYALQGELSSLSSS